MNNDINFRNDLLAMNKTAVDAIWAGLKMLKKEEQKIIALQKAIEKGEKSDEAKNFDSKTHLKKLKSKKK